MELQNQPMAKRDTTEFSEQIAKILSENDLSAMEQKEILNQAKMYLVESYSEKQAKHETIAKENAEKISILNN